MICACYVTLFYHACKTVPENWKICDNKGLPFLFKSRGINHTLSYATLPINLTSRKKEPHSLNCWFSCYFRAWVEHVSTCIVHKQLSTLDKDSGPDDLHSFMIQILGGFLAEPIPAVYNKPLQRGEVPCVWRKAIICPIFIIGDLEDAAIYRPASFTSVSCIWTLPKNALLLVFFQTHDTFRWANMTSFPFVPACPTRWS